MVQSSRSGINLLIVDDDEWVRHGRAEGLAETGRFGKIQVLDHSRALAHLEGETAPDVALVDAFDPDRPWDKFAGVSVVRHLRDMYGNRVRVIVITGHDSNEALRRRCADAGADYLYSHYSVRSIDRLLDAIDSALACDSTSPSRTSRLDDALQLVAATSMQDLFRPGSVQKQSAVSRRKIITLRSRLSQLLGLSDTMPLRGLAATLNEARGETDRTP